MPQDDHDAQPRHDARPPRGLAKALAWADRLGLPGALLVAAIALPLSRPWATVMYNPDEGQELLKARHLMEGYRLYEDVWCDQVPLHTHMLAGWMGVFGQSLLSARSLTLVLAALAAASLWRLVRRGMTPQALGLGTTAGPVVLILAPLSAVLLLLAGQEVIRFSAAAMIGPPAIFLAVVALDLCVSAKRRAGVWADLSLTALAGLVFAASLLVKPVTAPLALVLGLVALLQTPDRVGWAGADGRLGPWLPRVTRRSLARAGVLAGTSASAALLMLWGLGVFAHWDQAVGVANEARRDSGLKFYSVHEAYLLRHGLQLSAAGVGLVWALARGWRGAWVALAWTLVMGLALSWHEPFRHHSAVSLLVGLAWLGGYGVAAVADAATLLIRGAASPLRGDAGRGPTAVRLLPHLAGLAAFAVVAALALRAQVNQPSYNSYLTEGGDSPPELAMDRELAFEDLDGELIALLRSAPRLPDGRPAPMFADLGYYAFLSDRPSPPWLAVISAKRMRTRGPDGSRDIGEVIVERCRDAGVQDFSLHRFSVKKIGPVVREYLEDFEEIHAGRYAFLRRRKDVLADE